jgi:uncharacterized protein YjiS (DUF1127 family)
MFTKLERAMNAAFSTGSAAACDQEATSHRSFRESAMSSSFFIRSLAPGEARMAAVDHIGRLLATAVRPLANSIREARMRRDLMALDDHMLNDIGLTRRDVQFADIAELHRIRWSTRGHPDSF